MQNPNTKAALGSEVKVGRVMSCVSIQRSRPFYTTPLLALDPTLIRWGAKHNTGGKFAQQQRPIQAQQIRVNPAPFWQAGDN